MDHTQVVRFQYSVRHFIMEHGHYDDTDSAEFTKYVSLLISDFWNAHQGQDILTPEFGLEAFKVWFLNRKTENTEDVPMSKVTVQITKHYGAVSVTFGLEKECEILKGSDFFEQRAKLQALVEHEFKEYEANSLPTVRTPVWGPLGPTEEKNTYVYQADRISIQIVNGKRIARVHGGKFSKFGVPIYEEVLKQCGLYLDAFPEQGMELRNGQMTVELVDEKPKRVTSLSFE